MSDDIWVRMCDSPSLDGDPKQGGTRISATARKLPLYVISSTSQTQTSEVAEPLES